MGQTRQVTDGMQSLAKIAEATSLSEIARRLTAAGVAASATNVRGWSQLGIRPREVVRLKLETLYGIPATTWRTAEEQQAAKETTR